MTQFNVDEYFDRAAQQRRTADNDELFNALRNGENTKELAVTEATQRKVDALRSYRDTRDKTWTHKLGLDPEGFAGGAVNFAASAVAATTEAGGALVGAPGNLAALNEELTTSDEVRQAYGRYQNDTATPEDMVLLNQPRDGDAAKNAADGYVPQDDQVPDRTLLDRLDDAGRAREVSETIRDFTDIRQIIDTTVRDDFSDDIRSNGAEGIAQLQEAAQNYEDGETGTAALNLALGLTDLVINGGGSILRNKQATLEYVAELAPDLLIGAASKPALIVRNVGMGMEAHNRGIEKYAAENNGELPPEELQRYMAANAFGGAALETLAQFSILRTIKGPLNSTSTNAGFSPSRVAGVTARETAVEAGTEAGQAYFEGEASLTPASGMDIYEGGVIGAGAGAGATGVGRTVTEARGRSEEQQQAKSNQITKRDKQIKEFETAVKTGNVDQYTNRDDAENYDVSKAAAALNMRNQDTELTEEAREANVTEVQRLTNEAEADLERAETLSQSSGTEGIKKMKAQRSVQQRKLTEAETTQEKEQAEGFIKMLDGLIETAESTSREDRKAIDNRVDKARQIYDRTKKIRDQIKTPTEETNQSVEVTKTEAGLTAETTAEGDTPPDPQVRKTAAEKLVTLSMANPDVLDTVEAERLQKDRSNGLTADQRKYLRTFRQSLNQQEASLSVSTTNNAIINGAEEYRGLKDYRSLVNNAITDGDTETASRHAQGLKDFAAGHTEKARVLNDALERVLQGDRKEIQVLRGLEPGEWFFNKGKRLSDKALRANGGFAVNKGSANTINKIEGEAKALTAGSAEMDALLTLNSIPVESPTDTSSLQQPEAVSSPEPIVGDNLQQIQSLSTPNLDKYIDLQKEQLALFDVGSSEATAVNNLIAASEAELNSRTETTANETEGRTTEADTIAAQDSQADDAVTEGEADATTDTETPEPTSDNPAAEANATETADTATTEPETTAESEPEVTQEAEPETVVVQEKGENSVLGNTAPRFFQGTDGRDYYSVSHAYETWKSGEFDPVVYAKYEEGSTKQYAGRKGTKTAGKQNVALMRNLMLVSFQQNDAAREALLGTGEATLVHADSNKNAVGRLLMMVRDDLHKSPKDDSQDLVDGRLESVKELDDTATGVVTDAVLRSPVMLATAFTQKEGKADSDTVRPLVKIKNFLTQLKRENALVVPFVKQDNTDLPERQVAQDNLLQSFKEHATRWNKALDEVFIPREEQYRYRDLVQFITENGGLTENVKTAMSYSAWSYLNNEANRDAFHKDEAINLLLNRPKAHPVSPEEKSLLRDVGDRQNMVVNSLGQTVYQAMGFSTRTDTAVSDKAQLESALGAYVLGLLQHQGLVERHTIPDTVMKGTADAVVAEGDTDGNVHPFIRLVRQSDGKRIVANPVAREVKEKSKLTQGYLDRLFGVEARLKTENHESVPFDQKTTLRSKADIPAEMRTNQEQQNQNQWTLRLSFNGLWDSLGETVQDAILEVEDPSTAHVSERMGIEGRNDNALLGKEHLASMKETMTMNRANELNPYGGVFSFAHSVWRNQRVGMVSQTVNPQGNKLHRVSMSMVDWAGDISLDRRTREYKLFESAVATGMGIKAENMKLDKVRKKLNAKMENDMVKRAIKAIKKNITDGDMTDVGAEAIANVATMNDGIETLNALHAWSLMEVARDNKQKTFDPEMLMMEVDGATNGPMLTVLQLGAAMTQGDLFKTLNRGGFFEVGSKHKNLVDYKSEPSALDLYEITMSHTNTELAAMKQKNSKIHEATEAIEYIKGPLEKEGAVTKDGRKVIKGPLTSMMFGQAIGNGIKTMFGEMTDQIYAKITTINRNNDPEDLKQEAMDEWITAVNKLIRNGENVDPKLLVPLGMDVHTAKEYMFNKTQLAAMEEAFNNSLGKAVKSTLEKDFEVFLARRKTLNQGANASGQLYMMMFEHLKNQKIAELVKQGEIATSQTGKAIKSLSAPQLQEIEARLEKLMPMTHSPLSKDEGNIKAGLVLNKEKQAFSGAASYSQEVKFGQPLPTNIGEGTTQRVKTKGYENVLEAPGVRSLILQIHSADSAISSRAYKQLAALNIHDANGLNIANITQGAKNLNEATFMVMLHFSAPMELKATLERTVEGLNEFMPMIQSDKELQAAYRQLGQDTIGQMNKQDRAAFDKSGLDWLRFILGDVTEVAYQSEIMKLDAMSRMQSVDQYALEGGQFDVTPELRQKAKDMKAETVKAYNEQTHEMATAVRAFNLDRATNETVEPQQVAAVLKRMYTDEYNKAQAKFKKTGKRDAFTVTRLKELGRIANLQPTKQGIHSVNEILNQMFPGNEMKNYRKQWANTIANELRQRPVDVLNVADAPNHAVLPLLDQLLAGNTLDARMREDLTAVYEAMVMDGATLGLAAQGVARGLRNGEIIEQVGRLYNGSRMTEFGRLGDARVNSDPDMVAFMERNPDLNAGRLMNYLEHSIKSKQEKGEIDRFNMRLLQKLRKTVKANVPVRYITRDSEELGLPVGDVRGAKGWYEPSSTNEHIGIKSPDFVHSAVAPEVMLHELTHQALSKLVADEEAKAPKDRDEDIWEIIQDLEAMREAARLELNQKANDETAKPAERAKALRFKNALSNIHEFIAWGMTNQEFMAEVLGPLAYETKVSGRNRLITGAQKFIQKITDLLFGTKENAQQYKGMAVMIANVSGLLKAASQTTQNQTTDTEQNTLLQEDTDTSTDPRNYTSEQVFDALGQRQNTTLDPEHSDHLRSVLGGIVSKLHGPQGAFSADAESNAAHGTEDTFLNSLMGRMPFASDILGQPFEISQQEAFVLEQVEVTMRAATEIGSTTGDNNAAYRELGKLYRETKARLSAKDFFDGDWNQATAMEKEIAQRQYDFIFTPKTSEGGQSDYLSRFAALGLAYKPLRDKMDAHTARNQEDLLGMPLGKALITIFNRLLNFINGKLTRTFAGQKADAKLDSLMDQLVGVEVKRRNSLAESANQAEAAVDGAFTKLSEKARKKVGDVGRSSVFRDSKIPGMEAVGVLTSAVAEDRVRQLTDQLQEHRHKLHEGKEGWISSLVTELKGQNDTNMTTYQLVRQANLNQQNQKKAKDITALQVKQSHADEGAYLTEKDLASETRILLRTDMASLMDAGYTANDMLNLVRDQTELTNEIRKVVRELDAYPQQKAYWVNQAENMGYAMVTGRARGDNLNLNAHNLARQFGNVYGKLLTEAEAQQAEPILDKLVSLYALNHSPSLDRTRMTQIMATENARGNESGVEMVIRLHRYMKQEALESQFDGDKTQFIKGYTKEIYNPLNEVSVASGIEAENLLRAGATPGPMVSPDSADPNGEMKQIFVLEGGGNLGRVTGAISNLGDRKRGTGVHSGKATGHNININQQMQRSKLAGIKALNRPQPGYTPTTPAPQKAVPVFDKKGKVVNYRYMMTDDIKDTVMERDNKADAILGAMAGDLLNKKNTKIWNKKGVEGLFQQYREEAPTAPDSFMEVSENSPGKEAREAWRLLPEETKKEANRLFGRKALMVRKDLYDHHFGYRKYSVADSIKKEAEDRNRVEAVVAGVLQGVLGDKAYIRARDAEDVWQKLVTQIKDIRVIKKLWRIVADAISNVSIMMWKKVPIKNIARDHRVAVEGLLAYQRDEKELIQLQNMKKTGYLPKPLREIDQRIVELEDSIQRNPVKELVDGGMFKTIVEDVDLTEKDYTYQSKFMKRVNSTVDRIPKPLRNVGKFAYMTHDTPLYKLMREGTQMADFIGRYTLYQDLINRKENPLSKEEALQQADETFVNYEIPTSKLMQGLNDNGLLMFTKYYIRSQKVLMQMYKENPAQAIGVGLFARFFERTPTILDSGFWNQLSSNPFSAGALPYLDTVPDNFVIGNSLDLFN